MTGLVSWLISSRAGRWLALALLALAVLGLAAWTLVQAGARRERARQLGHALETLRTRIRTDDDLARLSPDERRRRLARDWGLPDGG